MQGQLPSSASPTGQGMPLQPQGAALYLHLGTPSRCPSLPPKWASFCAHHCHDICSFALFTWEKTAAASLSVNLPFCAILPSNSPPSASSITCEALQSNLRSAKCRTGLSGRLLFQFRLCRPQPRNLTTYSVVGVSNQSISRIMPGWFTCDIGQPVTVYGVKTMPVEIRAEIHS